MLLVFWHRQCLAQRIVWPMPSLTTHPNLTTCSAVCLWQLSYLFSFRWKSLEFTTVAHVSADCFVDLHINCVVFVCCRRRWNSLSVETRLEQSATCFLSSQTLVNTWHIVSRVPAEMSRDTALKQRIIFAVWPSTVCETDVCWLRSSGPHSVRVLPPHSTIDDV